MEENIMEPESKYYDETNSLHKKLIKDVSKIFIEVMEKLGLLDILSKGEYIDVKTLGWEEKRK
jgi:hypothetical protein